MTLEQIISSFYGLYKSSESNSITVCINGREIDINAQKRLKYVEFKDYILNELEPKCVWCGWDELTEEEKALVSTL